MKTKKYALHIDSRDYRSKRCHLKCFNTAINIIANWDVNRVNSLSLYAEEDRFNAKFKIPKENVYSIEDLGLYDNEEPNDTLKKFFDVYYDLLQQFKSINMTYKYVELLKEKKNLILTGAPGTGKTHLAKEIAKQIIEENGTEEQIGFVQFHPSYDYTDFVEGLRPTKPDANGTIGFELKD
ncbi:ATP-binding protein [Ornithobacterium rhinotracheale]|nr:ATP-binding protein [Ornithobacterium rhinotracheale]MCK0193203.1 ATP-binding protein [Ornithobacterium rhinotracheale]MCK0200876.1 ATP-binding protein [Ornithobacterium rhinotracheale]UOH63255.1 ATP-binding protein [Ornithobacterium rhinotracheale]UOH66721.1 ATP-binding protein [Ornithobacterium rhinotracheale]UVD87228.1 ATP-binding protein [Ornithobacterium rhinotracheale]